MSEEVTQPTEQSAILSEQEVQATLSGESTDDVQLPSDVEPFEIPEKFKGKSAEEIAKAYIELEKMKAKQTEEVETEEGGDEVSDEGPKEEELTKDQKEQYRKYEESYEKNGSLSEEEYAELAEAGYTKEQVDEEISYRNWKKEKALNDVLGPLGGGTEKFKEVSDWARQNKTQEELTEFNKALASSSKLAQQALLKTLYAEYEQGTSNSEPLHTNAPQKSTTKGYATESEFFADLNNPAYKSDPSYNKKVQEKLERSNRENWSF